jgi:hypothetical protein
MANRQIRVTFQREFTVREDQGTDSIAHMYKENYGMDVVKVEDIIRCKACMAEVTAIDPESGLCKCCTVLRDGLRERHYDTH